MEKLAHDIAARIASQMQYDDNKRAVIAYGLTAIFQMSAIAAIVTVIGLIFGFWYECMVLFIGVGLIRKSTGGAHSQTLYGCLIISVFTIVTFSALSRYVLNYPLDVYINLGISAAAYILCMITAYLRVPVDSPNKPIVKPEKIKRLRKQSYLILTVFLLLSAACVLLSATNERFYSIAVSIRLAMLWQVFTLTKPGAFIIYSIDSRFKAFTAGQTKQQ